MPLQATSGAASYDAFGGGVAAVPQYVEDVFSTYLYTGNGSTQTITNGIDLAGKGGMVWGKTRNAVVAHTITDTVRGVDKELFTNTTDAQVTRTTGTGSVYAFNSNGFSTSGVNGFINYSGYLECAWTFRKQPKFFDVVTYTGDGSSPRNISHNLGSVPGFIITKRTNISGYWECYHRSLGAPQFIELNATDQAYTSSTMYPTDPTSTTFAVGSNLNASGSTYVAYIFAHDAGGFGLTGTDNVISCGSFTQASGGTTVNLGFEPQWVMVKNSSGTGNWFIFDNMRGNTVTLYPNLSNAEGDQGAGSFQYNATGFTMADYITGAVGDSLIYIAIRRGPMKVPTSGTSVYNAITWSGNDVTGRTLAHGLSSPPDLSITQWRNGLQINLLWDKLRGLSTTAAGNSVYLRTPSTSGDGPIDNYYYIPDMANVAFGVTASGGTQINGSSSTMVGWNFQRAPSFFDEVCYTGTGSYPSTVNHNLGVVPELIIFKARNDVGHWWTYAKPLTSPNANWYQNYLRINSTAASASDTTSLTSSPTSTTIPIADFFSASGKTYVAYLFASCPGVSKVGSYTGTGTTKQIDCGFTGGARFVLIKRTDSTGDWYVWDTARGIVSGNDPYLLLNSTAAEVTSTDYIDTYSAGFEISSTAPAAINASGGTFIFLAIA